MVLVLICFLTVAILPNLARAADGPPSRVSVSPVTVTLSTGEKVAGNYITGSATSGLTGTTGWRGARQDNILFYGNDGNYYVGVGNTGFTPFTGSDSVLNQIFDKAAYTAATGTTGGSALDSTIPLVGRIIGAILIIIQWFLGKLIYTAGLLLDGVLGIKNFTKVETVQHGWTVVRDLCNMLFALILLIIAFATILHLETYGMKQLLWKLVVAAILINFSFTLAGVIIDFSQVLTVFFVENSKNAATGGQVSATLVLGGLGFDKLFGFDQGFWAALSNAGITTWAGPTIGTLIELLLIIILLAVALFAVLALAILFLIRIIVLWVILIFAPLAWLCMVLPATQSIWNKWWDYLLKYSFFAPVATFLLYLAILLIQKGEIGGMGTNTAGVQKQYISSFLNNPMNFMQYIMVIGLLVVSVLVARSMGIMGASAVISMGKGAKSLALGAIGGGTAAGAAWGWSRYKVATAPAAERTGQRMALTADKWRQNRLLKYTGAAWVAGQASRIPLAYATTGRQEIEKAKKIYGTRTTDNLDALLPSLNPAGKAAVMEIIAERGKSELLEKHRKHFPLVSRRGINKETILTANPDWAKDIGEKADDYTKKAMQKGLLNQMSVKTLENPEVADSFRRMAVSELAFANSVNNLPDHLKQAMQSGLNSKIESSGERDDFTNKDNLARRNSYAQITGDLASAFKDSIGAINHAAVSQHIKTMTTQQVAQMKTTDKDSHALFAQHLTKIQAANIARSGIVPPQIMANISQLVPAGEVKDYIEKSEAWGAHNLTPNKAPKQISSPPHLAGYTKETKF